MTLNEINTAIDSGKIVHCQSDSYTVIRRKDGLYVRCANGSIVGLTRADNVTLNYRESDIYIGEKCES